MLKLEHKHHEEFSSAPLLPFITEMTGDVGGKVRAVGGSGAGNVTYVQIFDGGYVPPCIHVFVVGPHVPCAVLTQDPGWLQAHGPTRSARGYAGEREELVYVEP